MNMPSQWLRQVREDELDIITEPRALTPAERAERRVDRLGVGLLVGVAATFGGLGALTFGGAVAAALGVSFGWPLAGVGLGGLGALTFVTFVGCCIYTESRPWLLRIATREEEDRDRVALE